jgi:ABC-type multidrug transport system fused ATPase/permease subunit
MPWMKGPSNVLCASSKRYGSRMNSSGLLSLYPQRVQHFSTLLDEKNKIINRVSNARLVAALLLIIAAYFLFQNGLYGFPLVGLLMVFVALVRWHSHLFAEKEHFENLVAVNKNEIASLRGDHSAQPTGHEFLHSQHAYAADLDLFGEGSVFQYLNRACTASGKEMLSSRLLSPLETEQKITDHQQAIRELSVQLEFRQHLQATGMRILDTESDREQLREWVAHPFLFYTNYFFRYLLFLLPFLTISAVAISFFISIAKPLAIGLVLIQWTITGFYFKRISVFHDYVSRKKEVLEHYARLLRVINGQSFKAELLTSLQSTTHQAETKVSKLASLMSALDARLNTMTSLVLNALLLYDLQCVYRLEKWKAQHASNLENWLKAISEMESLNSFATYAFNNSSYGYALISNQQKIEAVEVAHPLLPEQERITNSLIIGNPHKVVLITGANMAGKSTFLRTLGVNLVLALNGAPVCARQFSCPVIQLRTGMRTTDSLKDHQSYFYAELKRLKSIVEELRSGRPMLILLDEILKGTNSNDKLSGSIALVKQLLQHSCLAVIATHDLALGDLEKEHPHEVINYHFEPTIENDQLSFDYRLKRGIAEKMNATFLMKKMGIV